MRTCRCHARQLALHRLGLLGGGQLLGVKALHGGHAGLLILLEALQPWCHGPHHWQLHGTVGRWALAGIEAGTSHILQPQWSVSCN